jgi:hypothetical protein
MSPKQFADALRAYAARASQAPQRVEGVVRAQAARNAPAGVSVTVQATSQGARVLLSGRGARAHRDRMRQGLTPVVRDQVKP